MLAMDVALSPIKLCLNFYPKAVDSGKLTQHSENRKNNSTVFHAPKGKHVLINMSPTEAVLITKSGKVYTGISQNTSTPKPESQRQIQWLVNSMLFEAKRGTEHSIKYAQKLDVGKPQVGFFCLRIPPCEQSLNIKLEDSENSNLEELELQEFAISEPIDEANMRPLKLNDNHLLPPFGCDNEFVNTQSDKHQEATRTEVITSKFNTRGFIQKCDECEEIFPTKANLKLHTKETGHFLARCKICHEGFKLRKSLSAHYVKHTGKQPFACNICGKSFYGSISFKAHKLTHLGPRNHQCSTCDKAFQTRRHLVHHEYIHKPYSERPFGCTYCQSRFVDATSLKYHIRHHEGQYNFLCDLCGGRYVNNVELQCHRKTVHHAKPGKEIITESSTCRPRRNRKYVLPKEAVKTGDSIYKYSCKICGKLQKRLGDLRQHIQRHLGDKPFACQYCELRFVRKEERTNHEKVHTNDRKFECDICGNKYMLLKHLQTHSLVHMEKSYKCKICDKMFRHKGSFTAHMDLHLGKKLYECTVCKENMLRNTNFGAREAVNMNCDFCGEKLKVVRNRVKTKQFIEAKKKNV